MDKILVIGYGIITSGIIKNLINSHLYEISLVSKHIKGLLNVKVFDSISKIDDLYKPKFVITCFA